MLWLLHLEAEKRQGDNDERRAVADKRAIGREG